jgi:hypothetical protein
VHEPAAGATLIPLAGIALELPTGCLSAERAAVDVAAIAVRTQHDLDATSSAQKESSDRKIVHRWPSKGPKHDGRSARSARNYVSHWAASGIHVWGAAVAYFSR